MTEFRPVTSLSSSGPIRSQPAGHPSHPPAGATPFAQQQLLFDESIEDRFRRFHAENPHVYTRLVREARKLADRGHRRLSINMLFEVLRHDHMLTTSPNEPWKLNNNFRAYYARLIMATQSDLHGLFEIREPKQ